MDIAVVGTGPNQSGYQGRFGDRDDGRVRFRLRDVACQSAAFRIRQDWILGG